MPFSAPTTFNNVAHASARTADSFDVTVTDRTLFLIDLDVSGLKVWLVLLPESSTKKFLYSPDVATAKKLSLVIFLIV